MHTSHLAVCMTQSVKTNTPLQVHEPEGVRYRARALRKRVAVSKGRGLRYASRSDPSAMSWPLAGSEASRSGDLTAEPVPRRPQTGRTSRMCHKPARAHGARAAEADSKARPDGSSGSLPPPKAAWSVRCGQNHGGCVLGTCRWKVVARTRTHGLGPLTLPAHPPCPARPPRPLQPKRVTVPRRETSPVSRARLTRSLVRPTAATPGTFTLRWVG